MVRVSGTEFDHLTGEIEDFERVFMREVRRVMKEVSLKLGDVTVAAVEPPPPGEPQSSMDTLGLIATLWAAAVSGTLVGALAGAFVSGARAIGSGLAGLLSRRQSSRDETREGVNQPPKPLPVAIPRRDDLLRLPTVADYLATAHNRMVNFSDELWTLSRAQLLEGFSLGESLEQLRDRLVSVAGLSEARARTVARTEIVGASNAGSIAAISHLGLVGTKTWEAEHDNRTRLTHKEADATSVPLGDAFIVGGFPLQYPGDPSGPPDEIINCRCGLKYDIDDETFTATGADMETQWMVASAVKPHTTPTTDVPWDKSTQEKKLASPMTVATAKGMYAWIDDDAIEDGKLPKSGCKFPHHMVNDDGTPGPANLAACSAGIGALNGARSEPNVPEADRRGIYNHLARHLRDGDREPPPLMASDDTMTAASYVLTIPDVPDASWFQEPDPSDMRGALTIEDNGRIYGWLAPGDVPHRSFPDKRITAPMGNVDYTNFLGRETIVAGGGRVVTGALTMDCGHASLGESDPEVALDHYDNACSIVASVNVGERTQEPRGVWFAGALMPGVTADQVTRMMACVLSGDWRPHRDRPGWREFTGALLVPVPGFPMGRSGPSVETENGEIVSSTIPVEFKVSEECGCKKMMDEKEEPPVPRPRPCPSYAKTAQLIASAIGLDKTSRIESMRKVVNGTGE